MQTALSNPNLSSYLMEIGRSLAGPKNQAFQWDLNRVQQQNDAMSQAKRRTDIAEQNMFGQQRANQLRAQAVAAKANNPLSPEGKLEADRRKGMLGIDGGGITPKDKRNFEQKMGANYKTEAPAKNFHVLQASYERIRSAYATTKGMGVDLADSEKPLASVADMAMIFAYMKMLDPGSTVREGEYATASNTTSVSDKMQNLYNLLVGGETLTPTQRTSFFRLSEDFYRGGAKRLGELNSRQEQMAKAWQVDAPFLIQAPEYGDISDVVGLTPAQIQELQLRRKLNAEMGL